MIVISWIGTKERIPVRQGRLGNYYSKQPAFTTPLELEEITIAVDERPVFEREIGPEGAVCTSERLHVLFVISNKSLDLANAIFVLNYQNLSNLGRLTEAKSNIRSPRVRNRPAST